MLEADVLVIGGGGAGCSAALHLAKRGARVVLLERGLVGSQASGVNHGGVRQQGRHPAELPLARRSREIWARMAALVGTDAEFDPSGHLKLARSAAEEDLAAALECDGGGARPRSADDWPQRDPCRPSLFRRGGGGWQPAGGGRLSQSPPARPGPGAGGADGGRDHPGTSCGDRHGA
ncbi:FAD-dependent oxidoreductase [Dankookia sp. P2]|uniref:FAD-dependent oxidoreductase n=1 Tax=Dankookia sp. P2 TaxID=3423955 RepID=UPI003D67CC21